MDIKLDPLALGENIATDVPEQDILWNVQILQLLEAEENYV